MRRLNTSYLKDYGASVGASSLAYLYEEIAGAAVVNATAQDGKLSAFDIALQILVGWGPIALAAHQSAQGRGSYFWNSFGGAVMFNRIDNLAVNVFGQPALTPYGAILPGETLAQARIRLGQG